MLEIFIICLRISLAKRVEYSPEADLAGLDPNFVLETSSLKILYLWFTDYVLLLIKAILELKSIRIRLVKSNFDVVIMPLECIVSKIDY